MTAMTPAKEGQDGGRVAAFTGHMVDAPGRPKPRFPESKVEDVRREIAKRLDVLNICHGFSSGARGSTSCLLKKLLKRGGTPTIFRPFPPDDFAQTSGDSAGGRADAIREWQAAGNLLEIIDLSKM